MVPSKGFYKCFGCGESGDVFTFLMKRLGLSFVDAVRHVAERAGVEIREVSRQGGEDPNRHLYEANSFAQEFFEKSLWEEETGKEARAYLKGRGIGRETAERFGLGFAPDEWRALREGSAVHGIEDSVLLEVGLLIQREDGKEPYDRFRNRVIFPIESASGRVLAFGGRILGKAEKGIPKYLNSPESPVYHKGEVLYGLSWAKNAIRREEGALVVEGYMDAVSLAAAGIENVVAPLGTSMTEDQARLLARYCTRVFLLFDSDPAGLKATFRAGDVLLAAGLHPGGRDTSPRGGPGHRRAGRKGPRVCGSTSARPWMFWTGSSRSWRSGTISPPSNGPGRPSTGFFRLSGPPRIRPCGTSTWRRWPSVPGFAGRRWRPSWRRER